MNKRWLILTILAVAASAGVVFVMYPQFGKQERLNQEVVRAAEAGAFDQVRTLVEQGAHPNGQHLPNPDGSISFPYKPPIYHACEAGDVQTVRFLIQHGVDLKQDDLGATLLARAIYNRDREMVDCLLQNGADPDKSPPGSFDFNMLATLVDLNWRRDISTDETLELMDLAAKHGADPNRHGMHGCTPLHMAVSNESPELVSFLLQAGARFTEVSDDGWDAMDYAAFRSNAEIVDLLIQYGAPYSAQEAASLGRVDDLKGFINAQPSLVKAEFIGGDSLLGLSLRNGHKIMSQLLVDRGSNLDHANNDQDTLLHLAARGNDEQMVAYLIGQGLDINARNRSGCTPLHETTYSDQAAAAAVLIAKGADLNARATSETTPTLWASSYNSPGVLRLLLQAGCDPNQPGAYDDATPLGSACHYAGTDSVPESVKVLLEYGADVNRIGSKGRPAIHWAVEWFGGIPLVTYLLEHGADPMTIDANVETAVDIARRQGKTEVLKVLEEWPKEGD